MRTSYTIDADRSTGVVEIRIIGFWTVATVEEFGRLLRDAFDDVQRAGKVPVVLSDSTEAAVQSTDTALGAAPVTEGPNPHIGQSRLLKRLDKSIISSMRSVIPTPIISDENMRKNSFPKNPVLESARTCDVNAGA